MAYNICAFRLCGEETERGEMLKSFFPRSWVSADLYQPSNQILKLMASVGVGEQRGAQCVDMLVAMPS